MFESGVAETVVGGPFLVVLEDLIGLGKALEFFFGLLVSGVLVRMEFHRQLAVGLLDILRGGVAADPNIRDTINRETSILSEEGDEFINKMIFWVEDKPFQGTVVNAAEEQKRILQNQALGKPINEGEVPEIKGLRARKGLLDF